MAATPLNTSQPKPGFERDPDDIGLSRLSPRAVTLISLLVACAPLTVGIFSVLSYVVLPCTLAVTWAFWRLSALSPTRPHLVAYCLFGGALAGWVNYIVCVLLYRHQLGYGSLPLDQLHALGAGFGVAYGAAYLPPLMAQRTWRHLRPSQALSRSLISCGLWGLCAAMGAIVMEDVFWGHAFPHGNDVDWAVQALTAFSALAHTAMLAAGTLASVRRHRWLHRLESGKVRGYTIVDRKRFPTLALEDLPAFSPPLLRRNPPERIIAKGDDSTTYRHEPPEPRFALH